MDEIVVQDARTFTIRWKQSYVDAGALGVTMQAKAAELQHAILRQ